MSVLSNGWVIKEENENITLFCCKASARCCNPSSPIWLSSRSSVVSVCVKYWVSNLRRKWECHFILFQSISKMLCSLNTDFIWTEVQCGECLCEIVIEQYKERMWMLLYSVSKHQQDIVLLEHRFDYHRGPVWWASVWSTGWVIKEENENITLFCCKASARCCNPSSPIWFSSRSSVVSVCVKNWLSNIRKECKCYFILFQSISKMLCSLNADFIYTELQCGECLFRGGAFYLTWLK